MAAPDTYPAAILEPASDTHWLVRLLTPDGNIAEKYLLPNDVVERLLRFSGVPYTPDQIIKIPREEETHA